MFQKLCEDCVLCEGGASTHRSTLRQGPATSRTQYTDSGRQGGLRSNTVRKLRENPLVFTRSLVSSPSVVVICDI